MLAQEPIVEQELQEKSGGVHAFDEYRAFETIGEQMHKLSTDLFPICRSITGDGVRQTLDMLKKIVPIVVHEIPTGTKVFDWNIPKEWNIKDAYIKNSAGEKIVDFGQSNLHVLNYSVPIHRRVSLDELKEHLYTLPEHPEWIPYRTSYYKETWGFCLTHNQYQQLSEDEYEVLIDSTLQPGNLTYGEYYIEGARREEVLISTHICHPSMCNDNLSGISVAIFLAKEMARKKTRYSYRFLFIPGTIGAIAWLSLNESKVKNIKHGLVASLLSRDDAFTYKKSRQGDAEIDQVVLAVLKAENAPHQIIDYSPYGYDERQFCSPGFNLPVGRLTRTPYEQFPEYHSSADNLDLVKPEVLQGSLFIFQRVIEMLELNKKYVSTNQKCEPHLGRRGLYDLTGGDEVGMDVQLALLWVLNYADGEHSLLDIYRTSGIDFKVLNRAAKKLIDCKLLMDSDQ
jgi:aminopeptidase-like protein